MIKTPALLFFLSFSLLLWSGCKDEDPFVLEEPPVYPLPDDPFADFDPSFVVTTDTCDMQLGKARLLPSSFALFPYEAGQELTFVNEQEEEAIFTVQEWTISQTETSRPTLVDGEDGMSVDTAFFCFGGETLSFRLKSDDLPNIITCIVLAYPLYSIPERPPVDQLIIFNRVDDDNSNIALLKSTDRRGNPHTVISHSVIPQLTLNNRIFQHVEVAMGTLDYPLWYTQRLGVVGFTDADANVWRLK